MASTRRHHPTLSPLHLLVLLIALPLTMQQIITPPPDDRDRRICEPITSIEICSQVYGDNPLVGFPNVRGQDQFEANAEIENFIPLIKRVCSNAIVHFLCSVYAPFCDADRPDIIVQPCRELCLHVRGTCEATLIEFDFVWPPHLECDLFPLDADTSQDFCPPNASAIVIPPNVETSPPGSAVATQDILTPFVASACPTFFNLTSNLVNKSYTFGNVKNCGVHCNGIYFTPVERNTIAPVIILLFAVICVAFTLFTVATFLIDRHRFHYPERPIIFISFCYLVISILYIVGAISKLSGSEKESFSCSDEVTEPNRQSSSFVMQRLPNSESSYKSASCVILFVTLYFFQMASGIWWIVLTLTWFLAAALKWGEEAVEKLWLVYHTIAWGIPALQIILVLALRFVDGDQLSGLCYAGNANGIGLGVFVFLPLSLYLLIGIVFLVVGFTALVNIKRQVQPDEAKARKIGHLIMRVGIYSTLYIVPNIILLFLYLYELSQRSTWEISYLENCQNSAIDDDCRGDISPSFVAFLLKYVMIFLVGICSTSWILSSKTFAAWQKFFCGCCPSKVSRGGDQYDIPDQHIYDLPTGNQYGIPNSRQYVTSEKKLGDLSMMGHPHTSV